MLKPQSIRSGVQLYMNSKEATKQEILDLSKEWSPNQEILFKKTLQQGGEITIKGVYLKVIIQEKMVTSKGEKDGGMFKVPGDELRF